MLFRSQFGTKQKDGSFRPFSLYTMRQAIEEGFILDVLKNYTTYDQYWALLKKVEDDPEFDFEMTILTPVPGVVSTVPELLVVILLQVVMGSGVITLIIAMVAIAWARSAGQIRGEVLRLREMEFVHASKVLGTSFRKIVMRHLLPNVMGTVLVLLTLAVPAAIFTEAFLSFIGLGVQPPMASWGVVTKEGARVFLTYPHELLIPSLLICATMLAFNLLGDGLRDALDPKHK